MRTHTPQVKENSMQRTSTGIAFIAQCCGEYEESFHFQNVGLYQPHELTARVNDALRVTQEHHDHQVSGQDHLDTLLRQFANGVPRCVECG